MKSKWVKQWSEDHFDETQIMDIVKMLSCSELILGPLEMCFFTEDGRTSCYLTDHSLAVLRQLGQKLYVEESFVDTLLARYSKCRLQEALELYFLTEDVVVPQREFSRRRFVPHNIFSKRDLFFICKFVQVIPRSIDELMLISFLRLVIRQVWMKTYNNFAPLTGSTLIRKKGGKVEVKKMTLRQLQQVATFECPVELIGRPIKSNGLPEIVGDVVVGPDYGDIFGKILVVPNCKPELIEFFGQGILAFISDEGGVTSHASVVAMSMGIPCIIGTRYATKLLKTGDRISMNLEEGRVMVL